MGSMSWPFPRADAGQSFAAGDVNEIVFVNASGDLVSGAGAETDGGTYISIGAAPAAAGNGLRLTNDYAVWFLNAAGSADIRAFNLDNTDTLVFGTASAAGVLFQADGRTLSYDSGTLQFQNPATTTRISVANENGAAISLQLRSGGSTATDTAGSDLLCQGGRRTGTGARGGVKLQVNTDDSTLSTVVQIGDSGGADTLGFYGATPVVRAADVGGLTDATTGTANGQVDDVGAAFNQATLNNNFADLTAKINSIRTVLRNLGLTA